MTFKPLLALSVATACREIFRKRINTKTAKKKKFSREATCDGQLAEVEKSAKWQSLGLAPSRASALQREKVSHTQRGQAVATSFDSLS